MLIRTAVALVIAGLVSVEPLSAQNAEPTPQPQSDVQDDLSSLPQGQVWLGTVRIPSRVLADGRPLPAGTYRVRLTGEHAEADAVGQLETLERWIEFVQGTEVKGRALAPVVPSASVKDVVSGTPPASGRARVERLRDDAYYRLWFNHRGDQVLVYLPIA